MVRPLVRPLRFLSLLFALTVAPAVAQPAPGAGELEAFMRGVALLWAAEDVDALMRSGPDDTPLRLDTGDGAEASSDRHAAAALRELFGERDTREARPIQITVAATDPVSGFGELAWTYRDHGAPEERTRSVYVAVVWQGGDWRISELRLMP